jgi:hypothetical protein
MREVAVKTMIEGVDHIGIHRAIELDPLRHAFIITI